VDNDKVKVTIDVVLDINDPEQQSFGFSQLQFETLLTCLENEVLDITDEVAGPQCQCTVGSTGEVCQHGGLATGFHHSCSCNCAGTGYLGESCEHAI
jgi:hypothetical protein